MWGQLSELGNQVAPGLTNKILEKGAGLIDIVAPPMEDEDYEEEDDEGEEVGAFESGSQLDLPPRPADVSSDEDDPPSRKNESYSQRKPLPSYTPHRSSQPLQSSGTSPALATAATTKVSNSTVATFPTASHDTAIYKQRIADLQSEMASMEDRSKSTLQQMSTMLREKESDVDNLKVEIQALRAAPAPAALLQTPGDSVRVQQLERLNSELSRQIVNLQASEERATAELASARGSVQQLQNKLSASTFQADEYERVARERDEYRELCKSLQESEENAKDMDGIRMQLRMEEEKLEDERRRNESIEKTSDERANEVERLRAEVADRDKRIEQLEVDLSISKKKLDEANNEKLGLVSCLEGFQEERRVEGEMREADFLGELTGIGKSPQARINRR